MYLAESKQSVLRDIRDSCVHERFAALNLQGELRCLPRATQDSHMRPAAPSLLRSACQDHDSGQERRRMCTEFAAEQAGLAEVDFQAFVRRDIRGPARLLHLAKAVTMVLEMSCCLLLLFACLPVMAGEKGAYDSNGRIAFMISDVG